MMGLRTSEESYVTHVFPEADRMYDVELTVTDENGASSSVTCVVKIDQTVPPETTLILDLGTQTTDWYRYDKKARLDAEDWTGISDTFYRINNGEWQEYDASSSNTIIFRTEGNNQIDYYSVDYYGNEEAVQSAVVRIDKTLPSLSLDVNGGKTGDWFTQDALVTLSGSDGLSGLDLIIYKVDTGSWVEYDQPFSLGDGMHRLWAYAIDKAGNRFGSDDPLMVNVDTGSPVTSCQLIGEGTQTDFYQSVEVFLSSSDLGSGVESIFYSLDGGLLMEYVDRVVVSDVGDHVIEFFAVDLLGNEELVQSRSFSVHPVNFMLSLEQPRNFLYLFNVELFGLGRPVVIGPVDVAVDVECFAGVCADINYVEFLVDGVVLETCSVEPFMFRLDEPFMGGHEISAVAFASDGSSVSVGVDAQLFIF